ncbi:MAG: hypothetical protein Q7R64_01970 [bacterium]|nr:hypothetical protein [bacterium]
MQLKKYRYIFLLVALLVNVTISYVFYTASPKSSIPQNQYQFLAFPTKEIDVYKTSALQEKIDTLYRAVLVSYDEKNAPSILVNLPEVDGFISNDELRYVPLTDKDLLLSKWNEALTFGGRYTKGLWESSGERAGSKIRLELIDSDHARSQIYEYTTDGNQITGFGSAKTRSGITEGFIALQFIFFSCLIIGIAFTVFRDFGKSA